MEKKMDFYKIQIKVIKEKAKRCKGNFKYKYGIGKDDSLFITDGQFAYFIPQAFRVLDVDRVFPDTPFTSCTQFESEYHYECFDTGETKVLVSGITVHWFENCVTHERIAINDKIYKEFEFEDVAFRGTNSKSPIQLVWRDKVVGIMMPVYVKGETQ